MKRPRAAHTILELIVGFALLMVMSALTFSIFTWCASMFQMGSTRLELQGEIRRINNALRRDVLGSCFTSISAKPLTAQALLHPPDAAPLVTVPRSAVSFACMLDNKNPANYDSGTGLSMFDSWTVYYPSTNPADVNECKLYRYRIGPGPTPVSRGVSQLPLFSASGTPFTDAMDTSFLWPCPYIVGEGLHCYSNRIRAFAIVVNPGDQTLQIDVTLQGALGRAIANGKSTADIVESSILLKAENTWPKL